MDRIIQVKVNGNYVTKDCRNAGVQGEYNMTSLRLEFDEGWDGFAKHITWWDANGKNPVERILTTDLLEDITQSTRIYICLIPGEPLAVAGECYFVIDGYIEGKKQRSVQDYLDVKEADTYEDVAQPEDPTPTKAEQLQREIETIMEDIQIAAGAAQYAEAAEESAKEAAGYADDAKESLESIGDSVSRAETARDAAETSASEAKDSETAAKASADSASQNATKAASNASSAANSARAASHSASSADTSAQSAASSAQSANAAKEGLETAERNAADSASAAADSATNAANSEARAKAAQAAAEKARDEAQPYAENIEFADGENLQQKFDNGELGGDSMVTVGAIEVDDEGTAILSNHLAEASDGSIKINGYATEVYVRTQIAGVTLESLGAAPASHNHDGVYAPAAHNHDSAYAKAGHNHDSAYAKSGHTHSASDVGAPTVAEMNAAIAVAIGTAIGGSY